MADAVLHDLIHLFVHFEHLLQSLLAGKPFLSSMPNPQRLAAMLRLRSKKVLVFHPWRRFHCSSFRVYTFSKHGD